MSLARDKRNLRLYVSGFLQAVVWGYLAEVGRQRELKQTLSQEKVILHQEIAPGQSARKSEKGRKQSIYRTDCRPLGAWGWGMGTEPRRQVNFCDK